MLLRIIRPLEGDPRCDRPLPPVYDYGRIAASSWRSSNHIEYTGLGTPLRLTTNVPLSYVEDERAVPARPRLPPRADLRRAARGGPRGDGRAVPRASTVELLARLGQAHARAARLPARGDPLGARAEAPPVRGHGRAARRDDHEPPGAPGLRPHLGLPLLLAPRLVLHAQRARAARSRRPRWSVSSSSCATSPRSAAASSSPSTRSPAAADAEEIELTHLAGYRGEQPVRIGNQAFHHLQNDVYGEMILAVSRLMLDARFTGSIATPRAVELVEELLEQIETRLEEPDAGLWELRGVRRLHSFTAADALGRRTPGRGDRRGARASLAWSSAEPQWRVRAADLLDRALLGRRARRHHPGGRRAGARRGAPAQHCHLGFLRPDDPRAESHVLATQKALGVGRRPAAALHRPRRLRRAEGGVHGLLLLARRGARLDRPAGRGAGAVRAPARPSDNGLGLYSEDILPDTLEQSGNFPQTYSHVGLINAAFKLSRGWD